MPLGGFRGLVAGLVAAAGCAGDGSPAPAERLEAPEVLFLVRNEVFGVRLDGTGRHSFGTVGDDRLRAGWPRRLPDGRIAVLADRSGLVFPHVSDGDRHYTRIGAESVLIGDGACGARIGGEARLVWFSTSFFSDGSVTSTAMRATTDGQQVEPIGVVEAAGLFGPSPDGDDHVLAVYSPLGAGDEIWRVDVSGDQAQLDRHELLARIPWPKVALSPSRLADGRVVYVQFDMRDHNHIGEIYVIERDGAVHGTGILGVDDLVTVGNHVVYEAGGGDRTSDLLATDLVGESVNLTRTPYDAEHLGWGPHDIFSDGR